MDAIEVEGLTKRYGDVLAVDGIGFTVAPGQTLGLLGGNGAGKTTTIAMLLGLLIPSAGRIRILGHDMARDRFAALARMNFSSPYIALPARLTVAENLRVYGHLYGVRGLEDICKINSFWSGPINSAKAHWAGLTRCIYFTFFQLKTV